MGWHRALMCTPRSIGEVLARESLLVGRICVLRVGVSRVGVLCRRRGYSWELEREGAVVGRPMCRAWAQLRGKWFNQRLRTNWMSVFARRASP